MTQFAPRCIAPRIRENAATARVPSIAEPVDPRRLFVATYRRFAEACRDVEEPGLVAIAVDEATGALVGVCGLRACLGRPAVAVLGRHDRSDLVLWDETIALRHVAIVLDPVTSWAEGARAGYRVFDLRTTAGVFDEIGRPLRSFRAEGPAVLRCGGQVIFVLPLGDPSDWPSSAEMAWAMLPQRVYLDECGGIAARRHRTTSLIFRTPLPRHAGSVADGTLAGSFDIEQPERTGFVPVGHDALRDGILLGRYERCDLLGERDATVSRVHALVLEQANRVIVIDLASTHGLGLVGGPRARVLSLGDKAELWLGQHTRLRWRDAGDTCRLPANTPGTAPPRSR